MIQKVGDWAEARAAITHMADRLQAAAHRVQLQEAHLMRKNIVTAFNTSGLSNGQRWLPLAVAAQKRGRKGTKPLIDTAQLRNSVNVSDHGELVFVGVPNKARRKGGGPLVNIAAVHENGKIIAQKRGGRIIIIKIPARSFIKATADAHHKPGDVRRRFHAALAHSMGAGWASQATGPGYPRGGERQG